MFEPSMCGSRIDELGQSQLTDPAEAAKKAMVDDLAFVFGEPNEPVNRTADPMCRLIVRGEELWLTKR